MWNGLTISSLEFSRISNDGCRIQPVEVKIDASQMLTVCTFSLGNRYSLTAYVFSAPPLQPGARTAVGIFGPELLLHGQGLNVAAIGLFWGKGVGEERGGGGWYTVC